MANKSWFAQLFDETFDFPVILIDDNGTKTIFGEEKEGQPVNIKMNDSFSLREMTQKGVSIYLGEAYMNKKVEVTGENRPLQRLIESGYRLADNIMSKPAIAKIFPKSKERKHSHSKKQNKEDIQNHYDISNDFYKLWLDDTMTYSCAYFEKDSDDLTTAQKNKVHHILKKLNPKPNRRLLDIGCGWGTLMLTACEEYNLNVTGITLSEEQYKYVSEQIKERNLEDRAQVILEDYRELEAEPFDYITSVGMFEHVGSKELPRYFSTIEKLLAPEGVALIHGITRQQGGATDAWLDKYIFPGGYIPGLTEIISDIVKENHLQVTDMESLRRHYQKTLEHWDDNFNAVLSEVKEMGKDERFIRMWDLYLQACAASFEAGNIDCIQYQITHQPNGKSLPMTRDYMYKD